MKWWNETKGYGFIVPDDGSPDAFVHYSDVTGQGRRVTLLEGQRVEFNAEQSSPKGPKAKQVVVL